MHLHILTAENVCITGADNIEVWELEEFLEDILNAEFSLVRDAENDGVDLLLVSFCIPQLMLCRFRTV